MIRSIVIACSLVASVASYSQELPLSADSLLQKTYRQAAIQKKNTLVIFHASWCVWCRKLDSSLNDPVCKAFFDDNYITLHLVAHESKNKKQLENPGANELMAKYSSEEDGIPFWIIFDKNGKWLADSKIRKEVEGQEVKGANSGCPAAPEEVNYFISVLQRTSKLTEAQLKIIETRFKQNNN